MDSFGKALAALGTVKTPITITAAAILVFYYLAHQILALNIFATLSESDTALTLQLVLAKAFWLAIAGLIFGGALYALPLVLPERARLEVRKQVLEVHKQGIEENRSFRRNFGAIHIGLNDFFIADEGQGGIVDRLRTYRANPTKENWQPVADRVRKNQENLGRMGGALDRLEREEIYGVDPAVLNAIAIVKEGKRTYYEAFYKLLAKNTRPTDPAAIDRLIAGAEALRRYHARIVDAQQALSDYLAKNEAELKERERRLGGA